MLPSLSGLALTGAPKRKRDDAAPSQPSLAITKDLDTYGCAAVPLNTESIDATTFLANVDAGTDAWFRNRLIWSLFPDVAVPTISSKGVPDEEKMGLWAAGQRTWDSLSVPTQTKFLATFNLKEAAGRRILFSPQHRTKTIKEFAELYAPDAVDALVFYLTDRVTFVKQGDSRMGLSNMYKSWSQTGFGKWAHITPGVGLRAAMELRKQLRDNNIRTQLVGGSHMIYKPPGGAELPAHTDGPRPATMITLIEAFKAKHGNYPTTTQWMKNNGVQSLVHFEGGINDGYTYAIGPMNPKRLYLCLKAVQLGTIGATDAELFSDVKSGEPGTARQRFLTGGTGPSFMKWKENLAKFNAILAAAGDFEPLRELRIAPPDGTPPGAFAAIWANGFPHGSAPNSGRRVTTTASLAVDAPGLKPRDDRVPKRVQALATIANDSSTVEERAMARAWISSDTEPYYGGKTHLHPEHAGMWFDPDLREAGRGGFYKDIAPTMEDAKAFADAWEKGIAV